MRSLFPLLLAGCALPPGSTSKVDPSTTTGTINADTADTGSADTGTLPRAGTTDSGIPAPPCGPEIARLSFATCAETTAVLDPSTGYGGGIAHGSGVVSEVGGWLAPVAGSVALFRFTRCAAAHDHQVRLVDGDGAFWTFGWDIEGSLDDASTDVIEVGAEVDFYAEWAPAWSEDDEAILLSDAAGPLFLIESWEELTAEQRGFGFSLPEERCSAVEDNVSWSYHGLTFEGASGPVELWAGQDSPLPLAGRGTHLVPGDYSFLDPCPLDWCGDRWWSLWAE